MKIVYAKAAQKDLHQLLDYILEHYIFEHSIDNAEIVLNKIETHIKLLVDHPEIGRPGRIPETRELVVPNLPYVIPYQVRNNKIVILRIFHGSRKWPE